MSEAKVEDSNTKVEEVPEVKMEDVVKEETKDESKPVEVVKSEDIKSEVASPESKKKPYSKTYEEGDLAGVLKTSAKEDEDHSKNSKYDPSILEESKDHAEIRNQVYYIVLLSWNTYLKSARLNSTSTTPISDKTNSSWV